MAASASGPPSLPMIASAIVIKPRTTAVACSAVGPHIKSATGFKSCSTMLVTAWTTLGGNFENAPRASSLLDGPLSALASSSPMAFFAFSGFAAIAAGGGTATADSFVGIANGAPGAPRSATGRGSGRARRVRHELPCVRRLMFILAVGVGAAIAAKEAGACCECGTARHVWCNGPIIG